MFNCFLSLFVSVEVSDAYVYVRSIIVFLVSILVFLDMFLFFKTVGYFSNYIISYIGILYVGTLETNLELLDLYHFKFLKELITPQIRRGFLIFFSS
jgi:hypothetical protein